jgi:hypothetical protein
MFLAKGSCYVSYASEKAAIFQWQTAHNAVIFFHPNTFQQGFGHTI